MAKIVGDIAVQVGADVTGLQSGMARASRSVKDFDNNAAAMAKRFAKVGVAVAAAAAAIGVGIARMTGSAAKSAVEIQNLSNLAGVSAERFQKLAVAAETVGLSQEKVADIFKDVNDKFGDFMATGAGPLRDFFEQIAPKVGVTADQFARLSGPEALQLYVDSLERAGVSQQQMTFYMEALASDATGLLPLLRDNGAEMARLGDEAQRAGRILGDDMVRDGAELDRKLRELSDTFKQQFTRAILENADEIQALVDVFTNVLIPVAGQVASAIGAVAEVISGMARAIRSAVNAHEEWKASTRESGADMANAIENDLIKQGRGTVDGNGFGIFDPRGQDVYDGKVNPFALPGSTQSPTSLLRAPDTDERREAALAAIQSQIEAERAVIEEGRAEDLRGAASHAAALAEIDQEAFSVKMGGYRGLFNDLSTLTRSENDKLFKIGQAAAIGIATVEGYEAAISAWKHGMRIGGPPAAAAFAAASIAKTGALISSIASANSRGSGGGVSSGGAGGTVAAEPVVSRNVAIELQGEVFGRRQVRDLINSINEAVEDGAIIRLA